MSAIRKQSIKGTLWVYFGFAIGALITYLLTHKKWFLPEDYGLTRAILEFGLLFASVSTVGTTFYIYKLFPYYKDYTTPKTNDLLGTTLKIIFPVFVFLVIALWLFKPLIIKKFNTNATLLIHYFYLIIPVCFSYLMLNIIEAYSYPFKKAVTISFLKEVVVRIYTLTLILLKVFGIINFETFLNLFALQYFLVVITLIIILYKEGNLWVNFKTSYVTKKFKKNIKNILLLTSLTLVISVLRNTIDVALLASIKGLEKVAVVGYVSYLAITMQAPIRTINNVTIPILSECWKNKNYKEIERIYKRTSINLLTFAMLIFCLVLLNYDYAIRFFNINDTYLTGKYVFILLGLVNIVELGTGVNSQIIGTSSFFRFELWTSILLTAIILPLSYFLTVNYGVIGPAAANLISFTMYNVVRYIFLYRKFNLQPFTSKTLELLLIGVVSIFLIGFLFLGKEGIIFLTLRSISFLILFGFLVFKRDISPDVKQVLETIKNRIQK